MVRIHFPPAENHVGKPSPHNRSRQSGGKTRIRRCDDESAYVAALFAGFEMLAAAYDFARFERIADVGGGHGALLYATHFRRGLW